MYLLTIPYQGGNDLVKRARFKVACDMVHQYDGDIFCPVIYEHTLKEVNGEADIKKLYKTFMKIAEGLMVYKLPGWETDLNIQEMINFFSLTNQPVIYLEPLQEHMCGSYLEVWNKFLGRK